VLAGPAAGDAAITRDSHSCAPALSNDESTLYVVVKATSTENYGYLLALDTTTLSTSHSVFLRDPRNGHANNAGILDISTASPTVAPDGDVYLGIMGNPFNGSRGLSSAFSGDLAVEKTPGDSDGTTPPRSPRAMVPSYTGNSTYLIFAKYNNYAFGDGDGINKIALLDPNATEVDPHSSSGGLVVMREVLTVAGPTPDDENPDIPNAVREWCINAAAVNPPTNSILMTSEDGRIYRWNVATNSLSQTARLTKGIGEPYVPTVVGPDGVVYTLNGGSLFALGGLTGVAVTLSSSIPDDRSVVAGQSLTFSAAVANPSPGPTPTGTVTFLDTIYFVIGPTNWEHHDGSRGRCPADAAGTRPARPPRSAGKSFHQGSLQRQRLVRSRQREPGPEDSSERLNDDPGVLAQSIESGPGRHIHGHGGFIAAGIRDPDRHGDLPGRDHRSGPAFSQRRRHGVIHHGGIEPREPYDHGGLLLRHDLRLEQRAGRAGRPGRRDGHEHSDEHSDQDFNQ
jgi:hypothetical protein